MGRPLRDSDGWTYAQIAVCLYGMGLHQTEMQRVASALLGQTISVSGLLATVTYERRAGAPIPYKIESYAHKVPKPISGPVARDATRAYFVEEALKRNMDSKYLMRKCLAIIAQDDMLAAILDDGDELPAATTSAHA